MSQVGDDVFGKEYLDNLKQLGVNTGRKSLKEFDLNCLFI